MRERFTQNTAPGAFEAPLVFVGFGLLYVATAAEAFLGSDSGLFAVIYADGGYAHPPGYPLYSAYLRATSWLPALSPAHGASLATALLGAAAVSMLYAAARRWGAGRLASLFAAAAFGLASHVWVYHSQPEVFALNHLLVAAILWVAAPEGPARGVWRVAALGLLAGLGLSHHHPIVLMAPVGLWGVFRGLRESERGTGSTLAVGLAALAAGLLPYSYLLAVEYWNLGWHWRDPRSLTELVHIFLRRDYGTFQLLPDERRGFGLEQMTFWARSVGVDLYALPVLAAVGGAISLASGLFVRNARNDRPGTGFVVCLLASIALSGPLFAALLPREPTGVSYLFLRRFHLFSELLIAFLAAFGADELLGRQFDLRLAAVVFVAFVATAGFVGHREVRIRHDPAVETYIVDTFTPVAEDAVVIGTGDHHFFGARYLSRALGRRTDVDYIGMSLLEASWYGARVNRRFGIEYRPDAEGVDAERLISEIHATGRPLYATGAFQEGILDGRTIAPHGTLVRLYPEGSPQPPIEHILETNRRLFSSFGVEPSPPPPPRTWARSVLEAYAATWERIAHGAESVGRPDLAERARTVADHYAPWREGNS